MARYIDAEKVEDTKTMIYGLLQEFIDEYRIYSTSSIDYHGGRADGVETARTMVIRRLNTLLEQPTADVVDNTKLTIEELQALPLYNWVWIEILEPYGFEEKVSAYYKKHEDYTHDRAFCCGYPGISFAFEYADYGKTWTAYTYKPKECED